MWRFFQKINRVFFPFFHSKYKKEKRRLIVNRLNAALGTMVIDICLHWYNNKEQKQPNKQNHTMP